MKEGKRPQEDRAEGGEVLEEIKAERDALVQANLEMSQAIEKAHEIAMDAQIANMAKSDFLAKMGQQIKAPMNRIAGFTDLLIETDLGSDQKDFVLNIRNGCENLLASLNIIVDFTKMGAGHADLQEIDFDLELLVYDVCEITRRKIEAKPVELACHFSDTLPAQLKGDPQRFRQIFVNLLDNAAKFTDEGKIELCVDCDEKQGDKLKLHFQVRDTGFGIKKKKIPTIFGAFKITDRSQVNKGGAGIGLYLCREIAHLMGGEIDVESKLKQGSTFHFTVWVNKDEDRERIRMGHVPLAGKKALVVDECTFNLDVITHMLELFEIRPAVLKSADGIIQALEAAAAEDAPFDICVIDVDTTGFDIAEQIGALSIPRPVLLAISAAVDVVSNSRNAGFNGFLPKPLNRKKLVKMIERLLWQKLENRQEDIITQYTIREEAKHSTSLLFAGEDKFDFDHVKAMTKAAGFPAETIQGGRAALGALSERPDEFDIVFLDIGMADISVAEAASLIKEKCGRDIAVVAMGQSPQQDCEAIDDYIVKPLTRPSVCDIVRKWGIERE